MIHVIHESSENTNENKKRIHHETRGCTIKMLYRVPLVRAKKCCAFSLCDLFPAKQLQKIQKTSSLLRTLLDTFLLRNKHGQREQEESEEEGAKGSR